MMLLILMMMAIKGGMTGLTHRCLWCEWDAKADGIWEDDTHPNADREEHVEVPLKSGTAGRGDDTTQLLPSFLPGVGCRL